MKQAWVCFEVHRHEIGVQTGGGAKSDEYDTKIKNNKHTVQYQYTYSYLFLTTVEVVDTLNKLESSSPEPRPWAKSSAGMAL